MWCAPLLQNDSMIEIVKSKIKYVFINLHKNVFAYYHTIYLIVDCWCTGVCVFFFCQVQCELCEKVANFECAK